jgi:hypothetical protein
MSKTLKDNESAWLSNVYTIAEQITSHISNICEENKIIPDALPPSAISTDTLLKLTTGYVVLFKTLQEHELLNAGAIKHNRNIH